MLAVCAHSENGDVQRVSDPKAALVETGLVWVDLMAPDASEVGVVEAALEVEAPTANEMAALEESARFYPEDASLVLMVPVLGHKPGTIGL